MSINKANFPVWYHWAYVGYILGVTLVAVVMSLWTMSFLGNLEQLWGRPWGYLILTLTCGNMFVLGLLFKPIIANLFPKFDLYQAVYERSSLAMLPLSLRSDAWLRSKELNQKLQGNINNISKHAGKFSQAQFRSWLIGALIFYALSAVIYLIGR